MQLAVSTMLVGVFPGLHRGTTWETPDFGGFQASRKPVLWLEAFPTASGIPGSWSATSTTNLAVTIPYTATNGFNLLPYA
ncbi:hypothetical protein [Levilactobacillus fujinensis]|uniref:Uncharacterized protein n=1 Tax=Levilactobacillus fujinensis TaxID=2486024 RepID=A0ABW1TIU7_9LACO|nr:hypothetical protein [Levilactobacillus fujinensis]